MGGEGRLVWFGIGVAYGAVIGVMVYRWWAARERNLDWRFQTLNDQVRAVMREQAKQTEAQP